MALRDYIHLFELDGQPGVLGERQLVFGSRRVPVRDGIPRFTADMSYATGNFSLLRERHATLQLDSRNGSTDRRDTILLRTGWPAGFFAGKLVLECGCGAGPDTEILRALGARVVSVDLAGVDVCQRNVGSLGYGCIVQADITDLPLRRGAFDIVFCHRVLQHTPDPEKTLDHILQFVKPGGAAFVHSYARTPRQLLRWKYLLRPVTRRLAPERLYRMIVAAAPALFRLTELLFRVRGGSRLAYLLVPFINYTGLPKLKNLSRQALMEHGIHDTFDALSPRYDRPIRASAMHHIAARRLSAPFEVVRQPTITLLRTRLSGPRPVTPAS